MQIIFDLGPSNEKKKLKFFFRKWKSLADEYFTTDN